MNKHLQRQGLVTAAAIACIAALPAQADTFTQWAPVVRTTPVYVHVSDPRRECWTERVTTEEYFDRNGVPLGAIAGGITGGKDSRNTGFEVFVHRDTSIHGETGLLGQKHGRPHAHAQDNEVCL